ncbi:MAG TPA: glycerophosphodiester phosphodiesterase [Marinobacter sp.]|nr:glycerophosphodiester phosphodiesterase [Marinobacter sp.]
MIVYGHRGARGEAPENTLPGFAHAYRHGIRHFELDLVLSRDGKPVIVHDLTVDRTTDQKGYVGDYTAEQLASMDARNNTSTWPSKTGIPMLADLLERYGDIQHLQLEVKKDNRRRLNILGNRLAEIIQHRNLYQTVVITSADTWFLKEMRRRNKNIHLGLVAEHKYPQPLGTASRLGCEYLCINWKLCTADMVEQAHRKGMHVSAWTVNRIYDMLRLEEMGVNSIITDYPTSTRIYFDNRANAMPQLTATREDSLPDSSNMLPGTG